ncbi:alpha/beta fold hydrolase [Streptomyces sp. NPDC017966]|uniref:alpha/beta fold hydrolase n=1 Tax=Streptomyces sp. NPDC017966 TaxID=3365023 RepID=UPI0037A36C68
MPERYALAPLRRVSTDLLDVAYYETGSEAGDTALLLHGFPYDIHSYLDVAPLLADSGFRVVIPYLRGHGPTGFLSGSTPRSGRQAALGADVVALMDALGVERAYLGGYDWGGRAANVAAALWPERGRAGLAGDPREIARVIWRRNSPKWPFRESDLDRAAESFTHPDYTDVVLHSCRHRLGFAPGAEEYAELEARLAGLPAITVPTITLDGLADGNFPATDGSSSARHFTGPRLHRRVADAGHNLPQERPEAFAAAVRDVRDLRQEYADRERFAGRRQDTT